MTDDKPYVESVALTGAAGWLGGRVLELLLAESEAPGGRFRADRIVAFTRPGETLIDAAQNNPRVVRVDGDVRNPDDVKRFAQQAGHSFLIHTAGIIHP